MIFLTLIVGLVLLIIGAELIIRGSVSLAKKLKDSLFAIVLSKNSPDLVLSITIVDSIGSLAKLSKNLCSRLLKIIASSDKHCKYNTTDIQSSLGLVQLAKLDWMYKEKQNIANKYIDAFEGKINFIHESPNCKTSWHLFVIKTSNRDELHAKLKLEGIQTSVHFIPIHKQPYYRDRFTYKDSQYPIANNIYKQSLSLPIYPGLKDDEINHIIYNVLKYAKDN